MDFSALLNRLTTSLGGREAVGEVARRWAQDYPGRRKGSDLGA